ncbi:MAG: ATP-binding cassette domain-containing protein [Peptococcaceae bacterium]|jgi:peptide/nickel transport system ATP-binding protein|nr:ATP-binding cassette domain-containing protein [Peptococcaceae bacterium]
MPEFLEVRNLKKHFKTKRGTVHAVDDVSFSIGRGGTLGIVGESGCGKSTLGRVLVHLEDSTSGRFFLDGEDVTILSRGQLRKFREQAQIIFQDPYSSLNPRYTVEDTIQEPLHLSRRYNKRQMDEKTAQLMDLAGIAARLRLAYPHELDGGRRQRVVIARALALDPAFVVCDEPVSALDVSIQAQILNLLMDLQQEKNLTYMFITHDLSVVRHISDDICVMYLGQLVEKCPAKELFAAPVHPYTRALLSAVPSANIHARRERAVLRGEIVSPIDPKPGCRFAARCPQASEVCKGPQKLELVAPGHVAACVKAQAQKTGAY